MTMPNTVHKERKGDQMTKKKPVFYSDDFKRKAVLAYRDSGKGLKAVAATLKVSRSALHSWVHQEKYQKEPLKIGPAPVEKKPQGSIPWQTPADILDGVKHLIEENAALKKKLDEATGILGAHHTKQFISVTTTDPVVWGLEDRNNGRKNG